MSLTSNEILNKEFSSKLRGYDPVEVKSFLDQVAENYDQLTNDNQELTAKVERLSEKLDEYVQKHDSLNRSILVAQDAADRLKEDAHAEANHLVTEAQDEAERIRKASHKESHNLLEDSIQRVYYVQDELEALRQESVRFKKELHDMLKNYHATIMDNRWDKVLNIDTSKNISLEKTKEAVERAAQLSVEESNTKHQTRNEDSSDTKEGHTPAVEVPEVD